MSVQIVKYRLTVNDYHRMAQAEILSEDDRGELEALLGAIRNGDPTLVDFDEYVLTTLATFAVEKSLRTNEPVAISLDNSGCSQDPGG